MPRVQCMLASADRASTNRATVRALQVLRNEWGFSGLVVSDWGGTNSRIAGIACEGADLEMPSSGGVNDRRIVTTCSASNLWTAPPVDSSTCGLKPNAPWTCSAYALTACSLTMLSACSD